MDCSDNVNYSDYPEKHKTRPGPCPVDRGTGKPNCPPPYEIVCINVDKVYESCKDLQTNEEIADLGTLITGHICEVKCIDAELIIDDDHPFKCEKIPCTTRVRVSFFYRYRFRWIDDAGEHIFTSDPIFVEKVAILSERVKDERIRPQCEVYLKCLECFVSNDTEITCCIGKMIIFKLTAHVQLLIPAYGFCPPPDECPKIIKECPEFCIPPEEWPPHYPPQDHCPPRDTR